MFFLRKRSDYCIIPSFAIFAEGKNDKPGGITITAMKKIRIPSEAAYLFALVLMALSVAMTASADFGVSSGRSAEPQSEPHLFLELGEERNENEAAVYELSEHTYQ